MKWRTKQITVLDIFGTPKPAYIIEYRFLFFWCTLRTPPNGAYRWTFSELDAAEAMMERVKSGEIKFDN